MNPKSFRPLVATYIQPLANTGLRGPVIVVSSTLPVLVDRTSVRHRETQLAVQSSGNAVMSPCSREVAMTMSGDLDPTDDELREHLGGPARLAFRAA